MNMSRHPGSCDGDDPGAAAARLLAVGEPPAWEVQGIAGGSPFLFVCDHAGARIPRNLLSLGLQDEDLKRHIAWDIGAAAVAGEIARILDATLILQPYSRLVIDCNRPLGAPDSIPAQSEDTPIPGNRGLSSTDIQRRQAEIFRPYHQRIQDTLNARVRDGRPTLLVSMHSFTPIYRGERRPWHIGLLYHRDDRMARKLITALEREADLRIGNNEPYSVSDETDYSIPEYGERRGLPHVGIEIRQDLITGTVGQKEWAQRLARVLDPLGGAFH